MKPNTSSIKGTCVQAECNDCGCSLLVFKNDIEKNLSHKDGELFNSDHIGNTVYEDEEYDVEITEWITINSKYIKDTYLTHFYCMVCDHKNYLSGYGIRLSYSGFSTKNQECVEVSRDLKEYYISHESCHHTISIEEYEEIKEFKPKKIVQYFKDNYKEEIE